jgi:TMEM175 potassium channel family protein
MSQAAEPPDATTPPGNDEDDEAGSVGLGRLLALSDGVFAIALTILVLDLDVPEGLSAEGLRAALTDQSPHLISAALSFAVLARFWLLSHDLYRCIHTSDRIVLGLGTALLAPVALIPFVTELLAEYGDTTLAVIAYSAVVAVAAFAELALLVYGTRRAVLGDGPRPTAVRKMILGTFGAGLAFVVAIPVALVDPRWAKLCWLLTVVPVARLADRRPRSAA